MSLAKAVHCRSGGLCRGLKYAGSPKLTRMSVSATKPVQQSAVSKSGSARLGFFELSRNFLNERIATSVRRESCWKTPR